jgi:hypothetical protein
MAAQPIEARHALVVTGHCFAVEDAGVRMQANQRLNDQREALCDGSAGWCRSERPTEAIMFAGVSESTDGPCRPKRGAKNYVLVTI